MWRIGTVNIGLPMNVMICKNGILGDSLFQYERIKNIALFGSIVTIPQLVPLSFTVHTRNKGR